jgi:hypothetical protein
MAETPTHVVSTDRSTVVSPDITWIPISRETPRGKKVLCINRPSGVANVSILRVKEPYFTHWYPLPKFAEGDMHVRPIE